MAKKDPQDFARSRPPLFWWFLANVLAIAFAVTAWIVCLNLFRDPTHPTSYRLMTKVGRLEPLENFTSKNLPKAKETLDPLTLEENFSSFSSDRLEALNRELLRSYLTNYHQTNSLICLKGQFKVIDSRPLEEDDFFSSGHVVRTQAQVTRDEFSEPLDYPFLVEFLLPTANETINLLNENDFIILKNGRERCAVINVSTINYQGDEALYLTAVPLFGERFPLPKGKKVLLRPPETARVGAPFPVFRLKP